MELRKIILLIALLAGILLVAGIAFPQKGEVAATPAGQTTFERINAEKTLGVCYIVYPPAIIRDPATGNLSGHFMEAITHIGLETGWKMEYQETTWSNWVAALQSGKCDVSIAPTFATIQRSTAVSFTKPLFFIGSSAIVLKNETRFQKIEDFNRKDVKIAVAEGEASQAFAENNLPNAHLVVLSTASGGDLTLPMLEVSSGRADAALSDAYVCAKYASVHPEVKDLFADDPYGITGVSWAVRPRDAELLNFLNTAIDEMEDSGLMKQWESQYEAHWLHRNESWQKT